MFKLDQTISIKFLTDLAGACYTEPSIPLSDIRDAISVGQIKSKLWLIDRLSQYISDATNILIVGGWIGTLSRLMLELPTMSSKIKRIISLDINPSCEKFADTFNNKFVIDDWKFKACTEDMFNVNYVDPQLKLDHETISFNYDVLINTSCEHIENFQNWFKSIPAGKLIVLQSNNYNIPEHVNIVNSLDEFKAQCSDMSETLYAGTLDCGVYKRYMIIGVR